MKSIDEILQGIRTVAIGGHVRPDGDCTGSCLGLYHYIRENYPNISATVYLEPISKDFQFLQDSDQIISDVTKEAEFDLFISLDASDLERLGEYQKYFVSSKITVCIDHHITNTKFAKFNYIKPTLSSTAETLFYLLDVDKISKNTAECLYTGIIHDTGVFKYSNTSAKTMETAGVLMGKGIDFTTIIDDSFYKKTYIQNQILGRALLESITFFHGTCIFSAVRKKDMDFYNVTNKDLEGIVEQLRITEGVECAIFMYECGLQEYKVSLRSKSMIDVSQVAAYFGGGGHVRAAGCTMNGSMYDAINNITKQIELQMPSRERT